VSEAVLIFGMTLVTFGVRYPPLALIGRMRLPQPVFRALHYVPVAVLTAIVAPAVLLPEGELLLGPANPRLIGVLVAMVVSWRTRNLLWTIVSGMAVFLLARALL
jgi:branched-subunit amino acid transport protein